MSCIHCGAPVGLLGSGEGCPALGTGEFCEPAKRRTRPAARAAHRPTTMGPPQKPARVDAADWSALMACAETDPIVRAHLEMWMLNGWSLVASLAKMAVALHKSNVELKRVAIDAVSRASFPVIKPGGGAP